MKKGVLLLVLLFSISFISATIHVSNVSNGLEKNYAPSGTIAGWINISIEDEPADTIIEDSFENTIGLKDLLDLNGEFEYSCNTKDCSNDYHGENDAGAKTFSLLAGQSKIIGLWVGYGIISDVNSVNFTVESNAEGSCFNQLKIDIADDGSTDIGNTKSSSGSCEFLKDYGCFGEFAEGIDTALDDTYCQKVGLSESPAFTLGAWVKKKTDGDSGIKLFLKAEGGEDIEGAECNISSSGVSLEGGEIFCDVEYFVSKPANYYVCIAKENTESLNATYEIKADLNNKCGFKGATKTAPTAAYKLSAEGKMFDAIGSLNLPDELPGGSKMSANLETYIRNKYGNMNCTDGCIIPVKFTSQVDQTITLKDLKIAYSTPGLSLTSSSFYDVLVSGASINTDKYQRLYLGSANLTTTSSKGNKSFSLSINGTEFFKEYITIYDAPNILSVFPVSTFTAFPTEFIANVSVSNGSNIRSYFWEFGDGTNRTTTTNKVTHSYAEIKNYKLKLTVTDSESRKSYRTFSLLVESPQSFINSTLSKYRTNFNHVNTKLNTYGIYAQTKLRAILNLDEVDAELKEINTEYHRSSTTEEFNTLMVRILNVSVPTSIATTKSTQNLIFFPKKEVMDLDALAKIGGGSYDSSERDIYREGILRWMQESVDVKISFDEISANYGQGAVPILNIFQIFTTEKEPSPQAPFLLIEKMQDLAFEENYLEEDVDTHFGIILEDVDNTFLFSTTEDIDFEMLPLFVSPSLDRVPVSESIDDITEPQEDMSWGILILILFLLLIIGLVVYIVLQEWYKNRYENYLFSGRNNMFNLITYIENEKKEEKPMAQIEEGLHKAGWGSEQITYVMKKYAGKRTGMLEIPVDKILELFKKNKAKSGAPAMRQPVGIPQRKGPMQRPGIKPVARPVRGRMPNKQQKRPLGKY